MYTFNDKKLVKVYSGKRGCMCGCNGNYAYTNYGNKVDNPGYIVTINERAAKSLFTRVMSVKDYEIEDDGEFTYVFSQSDTRTNMLVFK